MLHKKLMSHGVVGWVIPDKFSVLWSLLKSGLAMPQCSTVKHLHSVSENFEIAAKISRAP